MGIERNILELSANEARDFFLRQESFCNIGLPRYFDFRRLLNRLNDYINNKQHNDKESASWNKSPKQIADINYHFFQNKDGRFSWRPLQIINPFIYVHLVNTITEKNNWSLIVERFQDFCADENIKNFSIPLINCTIQTDTANTVFNWWTNIEQQSLKLSMHYNYLMITDIADCYSSIYTHSITWAMCEKENAKKIIRKEEKGISDKTRKRYKIGDDIDKKMQGMSYQQTNGIPQGSVLMDFIAELVLGYADLELSRRLSTLRSKSKKALDYKVLRYRDDYRIFGKTQEDVIKIAKELTEVLADLNFRLNTQKTIITQDLVSDALKPDKLYYITHDFKQIEEQEDSLTLQKRLLQIYSLSKEHPNSGTLQKAMGLLFRRICDWKKLDLLKEEAEVLISIATNIAYNNPRVYKEYVAIVSKILLYMIDGKKKKAIIKQILEKFHQLPNVGFLEIWLQRLTIKDNRKMNYHDDLCKYASGKKKHLWNINWLKDDVKRIFEENLFIDEEAIKGLTEVIESREIEKFRVY